MDAAAPGIAGGLFKTRNFLFFVAVLSMHMIVSRPTPADATFMVVLLLSVLVNPTINGKVLTYLMLTLTWVVCIYISAMQVMSDPDVQFQLLSHTFVMLLGLSGCLAAVSWGQKDFDTFMKVYLVACCFAASLGIAGFAGGVEMFTWDGRASGLFPEPNVLGGFLLPGVLASLYLHSQRRGGILPLVALVICAVGVVLSFSRAAISSMIIFAPLYYLVINRDRFARAVVYLLFAIGLAVVLATVALVGFEGFAAKVLDRSTVAKSYDSGHFGRYNRYLLSIPLILENPNGIGPLQIEKIWPEPIHNLFIGAFLDYGWVAGIAWFLLTLLSFKIAFENHRATRSPISMWLAFSLLTQLPSALLQQVEHWRHMWLFFGLLWGFNIRNFPAASQSLERPAFVAPPQWRMERS